MSSIYSFIVLLDVRYYVCWCSLAAIAGPVINFYNIRTLLHKILFVEVSFTLACAMYPIYYALAFVLLF